MFLLAVVAAVRLPAQTLQTLASFDGSNGASPEAALTLGSDGNFYGTTSGGGLTNCFYTYKVGSQIFTNSFVSPGGCGTIFKITANGVLTTLYAFSYIDGASPQAALIEGTDGCLYGTTSVGNGAGTVFKVTTSGHFTTLATFYGTNGNSPQAPLVQSSDGSFYGTTFEGGTANSNFPGGMGTVFRVTTNGTLATLVSFAETNGVYPRAALTRGSDGNFYGTTEEGGSYGYGTVFKMTSNGTLTTLYSFGQTNDAGSNPSAALIQANDGNLYGIAGSEFFKITPDGNLTPLYIFDWTTEEFPSDIIQINGQFYGTFESGWFFNTSGGIFQMTTSGVNTILASFSFTNGARPLGLTFGSDGNIYGTAQQGGITNSTFQYGMGTVFRLLLPPVITAPTMLANGQFQFSFDTATRVNYAVEYSTNLTQWFPFVTLGGVGLPLTLIDPNTGGSPQRFYRIILSPQ